MGDIKVGVIPAAGAGKRLSELPLTKILPKPMLPVLNKPILEYVIRNMKKMGTNQIYIVVGNKKGCIQNYFEDGSDFDIKIDYIHNKNVKEGLAYSIGLAEEFVKEPFVVILGDDLTITNSFENLKNIFKKNKALAVEGITVEKNIEKLKQTCCVKIDENGLIKNLIEKPVKPSTNIRGCGIYIFDPKIFDFIKKTPLTLPRNEREITNTLKIMAQENYVYGACVNGKNININTFSDLLEATKILLKLKSEIR